MNQAVDVTRPAPWKLWTGRVLSALPILVFVPSAAMKLKASPEFLQQWTSLGYSPGAAMAIGIVELVCLAIYLIPPTRVLGAILLTGYLGGAVSTHVRAGQPFVIPIVVGVLVWGGIFLRDARLQALLPLVKDGQAK